VIDKNLVSAFVPFLPLTREHVKMCITDKVKAKRIGLRSHLVDNIADEMEYVPNGIELFSSTGCKRVDEKVDLHGRYEL